MQIFRIVFLSAISFVLTRTAYSQNSIKGLTAEQIIQRAIDSSGGDKVFAVIKNIETISHVITAKGDTLSFSAKRSDFEKYYVSTLSLGYLNETKVYNNGKAVTIKNQNAEAITDPLKLEELQLQAYISPEYGYKKMAYKLERQDDQKFENFDCYVVLVKSPLKRTTINYYDKKTGRLLMIIYSNLNKSVFIDYYKDNGISYPSKILMIDTAGTITSSTLTKLAYDDKLDPNWFTIPASGTCKAPEGFKTGTFKYINGNDGAVVERSKNKQTETAGELKLEYRVEWSTDNDYLMFRLKDPSKAPTNENIEYIKVRITSWTDNKYYCHYIANGNVGGTCAFEKIK